MRNANSNNVRRVKVRKVISDLEVALILKNLEGVERCFAANLCTMDTLDVDSEIARLAGKKNQD